MLDHVLKVFKPNNWKQLDPKSNKWTLANELIPSCHSIFLLHILTIYSFRSLCLSRQFPGVLDRIPSVVIFEADLEVFFIAKMVDLYPFRCVFFSCFPAAGMGIVWGLEGSCEKGIKSSEVNWCWAQRLSNIWETHMRWELSIDFVTSKDNVGTIKRTS